MPQSFADIGKNGAIDELYHRAGIERRQGGLSAVTADETVCLGSSFLMEGVDFNLVYFPLKHLGYKAMTIAVGRIYAQCCHPFCASVRLGVSSKLDFDEIASLWEGITVAFREHGLESIDLDLAPSPNGLAISISVMGKGPVLKRPAPASKDLVCISGSVGGAFLGMQLLEKGRREFEKEGIRPDLEKYKMLVGDYLKPEIRPSVAGMLAEAGIVPCAGYLAGAGLADCMKRIASSTGFGVKVYADRIPFEGGSFDAGKILDIDPVSAAMSGGEDWRLVYIIPLADAEKFRRDFQTFDIIGHLAQPEAGTVLVSPDGLEHPVTAPGWKEPEEE